MRDHVTTLCLLWALPLAAALTGCEVFDRSDEPAQIIDNPGWPDTGWGRTDPVDAGAVDGEPTEPRPSTPDTEPGLPDGVSPPSAVDVVGPSPEDADGGEVSPTWCTTYGQPQVAGTLPPSIPEASGMVVSPSQEGVLWLHNDSGDQPRIYAIEPSGGRLATITLGGNYAYDWEDMAAGPCAGGQGTSGCLYIGDIGDNKRQRLYLKVHRVPEPDVSLGDQLLSADDYESMTIVYPDEPHDCESLVVDKNGHVYLLTKEWDTTTFRLYGTPYMPGTIETPLQFLSEHDVGDLGGTVPLVTAASFSIPRNRLLVRTYGGAFEYQLPEGSNLTELQWATVHSVPVANEGQGEAIAYGVDGYWHVSEGNQPPIWRILCAP